MAVDTVTYEILRHRLWILNDEMGKVIKRISGSPVVYDSNDFATGLFDAEGNQIFVSCYMTGLAASLQDCAKYILDTFKGDIREGDIFYTNDPWVGVVHYNDFASLEPVFWEGEIVALTGIVMHEVDVGGPRPLAPTKASDAFGEAPVFPPLKLVEQGNLRTELERVFLKNTRTPGLVGLDIRARIAAHGLSREAIQAIVREYGKDTLKEVLSKTKAFAKESIKYKLRHLPDGIWREESYLDHDGFENRLYKVALTMTKQDERLGFDFTSSAKEAPGPINLTPPGLKGAVTLGVLPMMCYDSVWCPAAVLECVEIKAEEGSIVNARYPAAIGVATIMGQTMAGSLVRSCIAKMYACSQNYMDEVQSGGATNTQTHRLWWKVQGKPFLANWFPSAAGYGARSWKDGIDSSGGTGNTGRAATSIEVVERNAPVLSLYYKQGFETVGHGKYRGGMGTCWAWINCNKGEPIMESHFLNGVNHPTVKALYGGYVPSIAVYLVLRRSNIWELLREGTIPSEYTQISCKEIEVLEAKSETELRDADVMVGFSTGGGGYSDPLERSPELVAKDVSNGWCSLDTAEQIYGVVLSEDGVVDLEATAEQRSRLRRKRIDNGRPVNTDIYKRNSQIEASGDLLLTIADCLTVVRGEKQCVIACARCRYVFSLLDENYKLGAWIYESTMEDLSPLNKWAPKEHHIVIRHYCCPRCALSVGCEVSKREDPPLFDTLVIEGQVSG